MPKGFLVTTAAVVVLLVFVVTRTAERGRYFDAYSSFSAGPNGTSALYETLAAVGFHVDRLTSDVGALRRDDVLLVFDGCDTKRSGQGASNVTDRTTLDNWVRRGGTLIVAGAEGRARIAGCTYSVIRSCGTFETASDATDEPRVETLPAQSNTSDPISDARAAAENEWHRLFAGHETDKLFPGTQISTHFCTGPDRHLDLDSSTAPPSRLFREGAGRIVLLPSADAFQNKALRDATKIGASTSGAAFLAQLLSGLGVADQRVVFDEFHHGIGDRRSTVQFLRSHGFGVPLAQAALAAIVLLIASGGVWGALRSVGAPKRQAASSYVRSFGLLYAQGKHARHVLNAVGRRAIKRIARYHRLPPLENLSTELGARGFADAQACVVQIQSIEASWKTDAGHHGRTTDAALVRAIGEIDRLTELATRPRAAAL